MVLRILDNDDQQVEAGDHSAAEHIIMIGSSRASSAIECRTNNLLCTRT
jgi:hypothetical protein